MSSQPVEDQSTFGVYDAKTNFASIVDRAWHGEVITITKHGKPVAQLTPMPTTRKSVEELIADCDSIAQGALGGSNLDMRELIGRDSH